MTGMAISHNISKIYVSIAILRENSHSSIKYGCWCWSVCTVKTSPCIRCEDKIGEERDLVIFKISLWVTISMESSRRDPLYWCCWQVYHKNKQIPFFLCFTFIPKTGLRLPKTRGYLLLCLSKTSQNMSLFTYTP